MATSYGGWQNRSRVWFDFSVGAVSQGSTHVTVTVKAYVQMDQYASSNGSYTQSWSGYWGSGSQTPAWNLGPNASALIAQGSYSVALTDSVQSLSFAATGRTYHGASSHSITVSVPARFPVAPSSLAVSRQSDEQHTLSWSRGSTYSAVVVQRSTDDGAYVEIARPAGNVASYVDKTTKPGFRYRYRVAGLNGSAQSGWSNIATVYTSPLAPSGVTAVRDGSQIVVDASGRPTWATTFDIMDGGTTVATGVSLPWTHATPNPAVPHAYTVRGVVTGIQGAWSNPSNTVNLLAKPLAPTGLAPNGGLVASDVATVFSWVHTPVDSSPQSAAEVEYRVVGDPFWWGTASATTSQSVSLTLDESDYEWRVRTKGAHPDWSDWSAVAVVTSITRPGVAVTKPTAVSTVRAVEVAWSWLQAQGRAQSAYEVELLSGGQLVERRTGTGPTGSVVLAHKASHGGVYTVRVRAATGGIWSGWAQQAFTVAIPPAAPAIVTGGWDDTTGTVTLEVSEGRGAVIPDIVNLFPNPRLVGDGTWAEVRRNLCLAPTPKLSGTGVWQASPSGSLAASIVPDSRFIGGEALRVEYTATVTGGFVRASTALQTSVGETWLLSQRVAAPDGVSVAGLVVSLGGSAPPTFTAKGSGTYDNGDATSTVWRIVEITGLGSGTGLCDPILAGFPSRSAGEVWLHGDGLYEKTTVHREAFSGSTMDESMPQPEDFRVRWLGAENASESVMEIERVRGFAAVRCIGGVSTKDGKPAIRLIATDPMSIDSYLQAEVPATARELGTLIATSHLDEPQVGNSKGAIMTALPDIRVRRPADIAGSIDLRQVYGPLSSLYIWRLMHGGTLGSGDVWWTDIGLYAGAVDAPFLHGSSGVVNVAGSVMSTKWDGAVDNSPSRATMVPETNGLSIERSIDGGVTWEYIIDATELPVTVVDRESLSNGTTQYRVVSRTADEGSGVTIHEVVAESDALWLGGGDGFGDIAKLVYNPGVDMTAGRDRATKQYSGRTKPVVYSGEAVTKQVGFSGAILLHDSENSGLETLERVAQAEAPLHLYRDPDGRRIRGMLSPVSTQRQSHRHWSYSASIEEADT